MKDMQPALRDAYLLIIVISLAVQFLCYIILLRQQPSGEQRSVSSMTSVLILFTIGYLCSFRAQSEDLLLVSLKLEYLACFALYLLLFMMLEKTFNMHFPRWLWLACSTWMLVLLLLALVVDKGSDLAFQHWFYADYGVVPSKDGGLVLEFSDGWGRTAYVGTLFALALCTIWLYLHKLLTVPKPARVPVSRFFIISFLPQLFAIYYSLSDSYVAFPFPVVPVAAAVSAVASTLSVTHRRFGTLYDFSLSEVMEAVGNPLFVVDEQLFIRSANSYAVELYPDAAQADWVKNNIRVPPQMLPLLAGGPPAQPPAGEAPDAADIKLVHLEGRSFIPEIHKIVRENRPFGFVVIMDDVTDRQEQFTRLEVRNRHLMMENQIIKDKIITMREKLVSGTIQFISERDPVSGDHMRRTSNYVFVIAKEMQKLGFYSMVLTDSYVETLCQVAPLHDVGKFLLPTDLWTKASLNQQEIQMNHSHVELGAKMVDRMIVNNPKDSYYSMARDIALYHHEWWDGTGYQKGLRGTDIPLSARIVSLADLFDSLTARRPGAEPRTFDETVEIIKSYSGSQFDPQVVEAFLHARERIRDLYSQSFSL